MTLKEEVIKRWKEGQGIATIQKGMTITLNLFDKSLAKLNDCILKGRFEVLGMYGERPFKNTIDHFKTKLHQRNIQLADLKNKLIKALETIERLRELQCDIAGNCEFFKKKK